MKEKKECKLYYLIYHYYTQKLREKSVHGIISIKEAKKFLFEWRLPNHLRTVLLKELEYMGLAKKLNKHEIQLASSKIDMENPSELFNLIGLIPED